eukprot:scaffold880_cov384-Prasinococcus_capsulatus_cf.AAC.21
MWRDCGGRGGAKRATATHAPELAPCIRASVRAGKRRCVHPEPMRAGLATARSVQQAGRSEGPPPSRKAPEQAESFAAAALEWQSARGALAPLPSPASWRGCKRRRSGRGGG